MSRHWRFLLGFALVAFAVAGGLSCLADADPDGLDSVSRQGCAVTGTETGTETGTGAEQRLDGTCIAQDAREPATAGSPLAGYTVGGDARLTGVAGVVGALATLAAAGALFRLLRRRPARSSPDG